MMKNRLVATFLTVAFACLAVAGRDAVSIKYAPKAGDMHKYRQTAKLDFNGKELDFSALSTRKVVKIDETGAFSVKEEISEMKFNGNDAPEGSSPTPTTTMLSARGELLKVEGEHVDETVYRAANLELFVLPEKPVNAGDTWSYAIKENKTTGIVAGKADYTFVGLEKVGSVDSYKIKFTIKEDGAGGASTDGTVWLAKADGSLVKLATKWINVPAGGGNSISGDLSVILLP